MNSEHEYRPVLEAVKAAADNAFVEQNTFVACELDAACETVAELIETLGYCEAWFAKFSPTAPLVNDQGVALHPMLDCIRAALARCKGGAA
jgi:hypothetical protein